VELVKDVSRSSEGAVAAVEAAAADPRSAVELGDADAAMLRSEGERLKLERDAAQLRAELAQINRPWWRKGSIVATMTAIIAAVVPVTTAVMSYYQKEREVALAQSQKERELAMAQAQKERELAAAQAQKEREIALQAAKQDHEIRTSYLDRLDKPGAKLRTLRFVEATMSDPAMKAWSQVEAKRIEAGNAEVDQQIKELDAQIQHETATLSAQAKRDVHLKRLEELRAKKMRMNDDLFDVRH
jgi:hypothetical protein